MNSIVSDKALIREMNSEELENYWDELCKDDHPLHIKHWYYLINSQYQQITGKTLVFIKQNTDNTKIIL